MAVEKKEATKPKLTRKEQAEETKLLVFNTALKLLDENPFEQIKIRDIVKAANVSVGTFYNYFSTKLDVYYETYCLADEYFKNEVEPALVQEQVKDRVLCFFEHYAAYSAEKTSLSLTKILYNSSNRCFIRQSTDGMHPLLVQLLQKGLDDGQLATSETAEEIADFLMVSVRGLVYDWCIRDGSYNLKKAMYTHVEKLMRIYT